MLIFAFVLASCGGLSKTSVVSHLSSKEDSFSYSDKNGTFLVRQISGMDKNNKNFSTKRVMEIPNKDKDKVLEQSVAISTLGSVKKNVILRPKVSQYNVWFDGKKYSSELKINAAKKAIDVKMVSPESQWNGSKQVKFPNSKVLPCFFSQVIECAKVAGFIDRASDKKSGSLRLLIIWEGYPYLNETFSDFPSALFSEAQLEYDGKTKESERRFNLRVAGQSIYYILNEKDVMIKMFWVTQGISMVSRSLPREAAEEGGEGLE